MQSITKVISNTIRIIEPMLFISLQAEKMTDWNVYYNIKRDGR